METHDDIQEDFCIKLDEYPLLTKFSTQEYYKTQTFVDTFARYVPHGFYFRFIITLNESGYVIVTPVLVSITSQIKDYYKANPGFFSDYVSFQLQNSGILPSLIELLLLGNQLAIALRVIEKPIRDFTDTFFSFHKDQSFFTMLQYYHFSQPFVLGTEVLLGYNEDESFLPHQLLPNLPFPEKFGRLSNVYKSITDANSELSADGVSPVVLRGKYKNGDTMVFSDTVLRHATITTKEVINESDYSMQITIPKKGPSSVRNVQTTTVHVCSKREKTTPEMVINRQAIAMFIYSNADKHDPAIFGIPFVIDATTSMRVKTINFNKDTFKTFVRSLNMIESDHCLPILLDTAISAEQTSMELFNRGGKRRRSNRRKTKKNKKNIKRKSRHVAV